MGLLTHLFPAKCTASVNLAIINYGLPVVPPRWLADLLSPEMPLPILCVSAFLCSLGLFPRKLASSAGFFLSGLCVFSSLHALTYLLPTVIPSHNLPLEQAGLSLHLAALSSSPVPSACLSGFPHMGLPLHAGVCSLPRRCTCLGVFTDTHTFLFLISPSIPIAGCTLTSQHT